MISLQKTAVLIRAGRRFASTGLAPVSPKLRMKQERMQVPDGKPIHLKGGAADSLMYYGTMALSGVCLAMCFKVYYDLSVPRK